MGLFSSLSKTVSNLSGSSVGGSVLNDALGVSQSQEQQYNYNRELQELSQDWQEKMSNTAYQRSVNDLTQAGMNPLLSYASGGATTGSASASGTGSGTAGAGQALMSLMSSFMSAVGSGQYAKNTAEAEKTRLNNDLLRAFFGGGEFDPFFENKLWQYFLHDSSMFGQLSRAVSGASNSASSPRSTKKSAFDKDWSKSLFWNDEIKKKYFNDSKK